MNGDERTGAGEHDRLRESLGAYLLGGLAPDDEREVQAHVAGCERCRSELARLEELVGPLSAVDPDDPAPRVPAGLDARVEQTVRELAAEGAPAAPEPTARSGRRTADDPPARRALRPAAAALAAAAALVGAAAATLVAVAIDDDTAPAAPAVVAEAVDLRVGDRAVEARAELVDHTWGMEIEIVGDGFAEGRAYDVSVTDNRGRTYSSGAFVGVGDDTITCEMSSAVLRADAVGFEVVDASGRQVLSADLDG